MWYKVNWNILAIQFFPIELRKHWVAGFVQILIRPLTALNFIWYNWRIDNIYKLDHTGQVCSLRGSLNDKFDPLYRRITLGEKLTEETVYIFSEAEQEDLFINSEDEDPEDTIYIHTESETGGNGIDFIVYVPEEILTDQFHDLMAHIDFYKIGGKGYAFIAI